MRLLSLLFLLGVFIVAMDAGRETWREGARMPLPVAGYMAGSLSNRLIIAGGSYWLEGTKRWSDRADLFDPDANRWTSAPPLPEPRSDAAAAVVGDSFYLFGGGDHARIRRDALVYRNGRWDPNPEGELPSPRLYSAAVVAGGQIYLSGGISQAGNPGSATNAFWSWDPAHPKAGWKELPPMPGPARFSHPMASRDGQIFIFGGAGFRDGAVVNLGDAFRYDIRASRWSQLPNLPFARRAWFAMPGSGSLIFLFGGYTGTYETEIWEFDAATGNFQQKGHLPRPLADAEFFKVASSIVSAGGETADRIRSPFTIVANASEF